MLFCYTEQLTHSTTQPSHSNSTDRLTPVVSENVCSTDTSGRGSHDLEVHAPRESEGSTSYMGRDKAKSRDPERDGSMGDMRFRCVGCDPSRSRPHHPQNPATCFVSANVTTRTLWHSLGHVLPGDRLLGQRYQLGRSYSVA